MSWVTVEWKTCAERWVNRLGYGDKCRDYQMCAGIYYNLYMGMNKLEGDKQACVPWG